MSLGIFKTESEYRIKIQETFDRVEKQFSDADPDIAECEQANGGITVILADKSRLILSAQPSVRQLWMAVAKLGIAVHFNFDEKSSTWIDDKAKGIELFSYLENFFFESAGLKIKF